jgi:uncharacterized protein DUF1549/uncharacterized protein DUF1553
MARRLPPFRLVLFSIFIAAICCSFSLISLSQTENSPPRSGSKQRTAKTSVGISKPKAPQPKVLHAQSQAQRLTELRILPSAIRLAGPVASQRLVVEGKFADGHEEDLTNEAKLSSSNPHVAVLDNLPGVVAAGDGHATLRATYGGSSATAEVVVQDFTKAFSYSFRNDVLPVMTKVGCNSGPCHGALAGKNGFKLTLRGYDPEADYYTLTRQALARRTERLEPAKSLILLKPTLTIPHGGGRRFGVGSPEYKIMSGWIAEGMPAPRDSDPRVEDLEVLPREVSLEPGASQQILVRAHYSDGSVKDVTRWAKFSSGDMSVATADDLGHVKMIGYGEAPVTVWYQSRVSFARLSVPFPVSIDPAVFRKAPRTNFIDALVLKKLQFLHIPPSRPATDEEFIRRAYLDAAGILPTPAETEKFLSDPSPEKRSRLIAELTTRPEFVDYWTYKWSDLLLVSSKNLSPGQIWSFYDWIHESVQKNKPWDRFVYEIVTATGNSRENGPANYFVIEHDPLQISENMTKAFLGTSITCAHCHNHPLEKWTQKDYFAMANLFARVRLKTGDFNRGGLDDATVYSSPTGDVIFPRLGRPLPPRPLDATALALDSTVDRRVYFAQWLTSPKNTYFARAVVNRVWKNFMGRGLVEAVDDLRETNPPTNDELFTALTDDFVSHGFDVRHLIRTIMNSATYQTAADPVTGNVQDEKYYSHYIIRRLPAEVMLDAISQVLQAPTKFDGYPPGTRALQLPDTQVDSYFLTVFGRPPREQTSAAERQSEPSITQALHVINGDTLNDKLRAPGGTVDMLAKLNMQDERAVDYLFLAAFCRHPSPAESKEMVADLQNAEARKLAAGHADPRRAALADFAWALVTSEEFMFDH